MIRSRYTAVRVTGLQALTQLCRCGKHISTKPLVESPCTSFDFSVIRGISSWKKRDIRREEKKDIVYQYVGEHAKRADRVYVWGYAASGALGVRRFLRPVKGQKAFVARTRQFHPHRLDFMDENRLKTRHVACGYGFSVFLCKAQNQHVVYGTGINADSQLGYQEYPKKSGRLLDYVIEPAEISLPLLYPKTTKLTGVACGRAHTVIQTDSEGIFSLGHNAYGQCARPIVEGEIYRGSQIINKVKLDKEITQMVCGQDHTLFLTSDGEVYSCGLGADGQTGQGHYEMSGTPTKVGGDIEGERIVQLSCKADTVLAVSDMFQQAQMMTEGRSISGSPVEGFPPEEAGIRIIVADKGEAFGWGNNEYRQLSSGSDEMQVNRPTRLHLVDVGRVSKVAVAGSMCAALNESGQVYVWGYGLLGKGPRLHSSPVPSCIPQTLFGRNEFNPDTRVVDIQAAMHSFTATTSEGDLFMWGRNKTGCLGLGHIKDQFFPFKVLVPAEVRSVACGVDHIVTLCKSFA